MTVCNDQGNPNLARQCARQAVSSGDVAVLGSYSQQGPTILPILEAAHIAYVGGDCAVSGRHHKSGLVPA